MNKREYIEQKFPDCIYTNSVGELVIDKDLIFVKIIERIEKLEAKE